MLKKIIILTIVLLLSGPTIISANALSNESSVTRANDGGLLENFLKSQSTVVITYDEKVVEKPIMPLSPSVTVPITIQNKISGTFAKSTASYCNKQGITQEITLSIEEIPEWCTVKIAQSVINIRVSEEFESVQTNLLVSLTEKAPAFTIFTILIKATVSPIKGPLSILEWINGSETTQEISLKPNYMPIFDVILSSNYLEISPVNITDIPLKIINMGNGKTEFVIEIEELPKNWNVSIPSNIMLETNSEEEIVLTVKPYKYFKNETIELKVTARYFTVPSETDTPESTHIFSICLKNDGSYKEKEDSFEVDTIIILLLAIILIIVILLFVIKMKRA